MISGRSCCWRTRRKRARGRHWRSSAISGCCGTSARWSPGAGIARCECDGWRIAPVRSGGCGSRYMVLRWKRPGWPTRNREPYCGMRATVRCGNSAWRPASMRPPRRYRLAKTPNCSSGRWPPDCCGRGRIAGSPSRRPIYPCAARSLVSVPTCWRPVPVNTLGWMDRGMMKYNVCIRRCISAPPAATYAAKWLRSTRANCWRRCAGGRRMPI